MPRTQFSLLAIVSLLVLFSSSIAKSSDEFNLSKDGVALRGFDPVSYFTVGKPLQGVSSISSKFDKATFYFSSLENKKLFENSPEKYVPAYGGWCSYGVRVGKKFDIDPAAWAIVGGRLFLQLDQGTHKVWIRDKEKNVEIADRLWPKLRTVSQAALGN